MSKTFSEKLGLVGSGFVAGCLRDQSWWERRSALEGADYVVVWLEDADALVWVDAVTAVGLGKRAFFAMRETISDTATQMLWANPGRVLERCDSLDEACLVASAIWSHDGNGSAYVGHHGIGGLLELLRKCESPIEARLLIHLFSRITSDTVALVDAQAQLGQYRIDFTVTDTKHRKSVLGDDPKIRLVIECDGHDFHERTKDQAARDKRRDRELVAAGWQVLRFTGSEIWNNPVACVEQIYAIVEGHGGAL